MKNKVPIFLIIVWLALTVCIGCIVLTGCDEVSDPMSAEEWAAYRESLVHEYEVCSVMQYIKVNTNNFGGITSRDLCYAFTYIDGGGVLQTEYNFEHLEYGLTKVCIGDTDKYVVDNYGETTRYLYLTKETLKSLTTQSEVTFG